MLFWEGERKRKLEGLCAKLASRGARLAAVELWLSRGSVRAEGLRVGQGLTGRGEPGEGRGQCVSTHLTHHLVGGAQASGCLFTYQATLGGLTIVKKRIYNKIKEKEEERTEKVRTERAEGNGAKARAANETFPPCIAEPWKAAC